MSDEHTSESTPQRKPGWRDILRASTYEGWIVMEQSQPVTGTPRQIVIGALLGVCVVILASMLGVQRLDAALQLALKAFVVAIVLLTLDFIFLSVKFAAGPSKQAESLITGFQLAAWSVGEGLGGAALLVGVIAIVWHLSVSAAVLGLIMIPAAFLAFGLVALTYAVLRERRGQQKSALPDRSR
jgi:hypothetical protein